MKGLVQKRSTEVLTLSSSFQRYTGLINILCYMEAFQPRDDLQIITKFETELRRWSARVCRPEVVYDARWMMYDKRNQEHIMNKNSL